MRIFLKYDFLVTINTMTLEKLFYGGISLLNKVNITFFSNFNFLNFLMIIFLQIRSVIINRK